MSRYRCKLDRPTGPSTVLTLTRHRQLPTYSYGQYAQYGDAALDDIVFVGMNATSFPTAAPVVEPTPAPSHSPTCADNNGWTYKGKASKDCNW